MLAEALEAAGCPEGVISVLPAGREVGEHLVRHPRRRQGGLHRQHGGRPADHELCGERIARVTLELGGKSAAIIADDIDLDDVLTDIVARGHRALRPGVRGADAHPRPAQRATTRWSTALAEIMQLAQGRRPAASAGTVLGPLAAERQRDRVEGYIEQGVEEGATLVTGGGRPERASTAAGTSSRRCSRTSTTR